MLDVRSALGPDGPIASGLERWEDRPEQRTMADAVDRVLRDGGRLLVEAGTGVGKSFAYLLPAIAAAAERGERVVIATHTLALQDQLLRRDLPVLVGQLPLEFSVVLAKGRNNYLCLRRLRETRKEARTLLPGIEERQYVERIQTWSETTRDGTRQGLDFEPPWQVWEQVQAEAGNCLGKHCDFYDACHYQAGRRRLQNADLIIANHAFLFADLALKARGGALLPKFDHLILDEAHEVEDVAGAHLGLRVSRSGVGRLLSTLAGKRDTGLLAAVEAPEAARRLVRVAREDADELFDLAGAWTDEDQARGGNGRMRQPRFLGQSLSPRLDELGATLDALARTAPSKEREVELQSRAERCRDAADGVRRFCAAADEGVVYWVERAGRGGHNVTFFGAPVDIGPALRDELFAPLRSVVLTSATLAIGKDHDFGPLASRLGLEAPETLWLDSPFDYRRQARLVIKGDLPDPREGAAWERGVAEQVVEQVDAVRGGAFVLFTAHGTLQRVFDRTEEELRRRGLVPLRQGGGLPRERLLDAFRTTPGAVLFGTSTFWQGIDIPGDALRMVVVTRLPFQVPTHPLVQARVEALEDRGLDAFRHYSLPQAVLRLKQGFGRLIRSRSDRGTVLVLDPRILRKGYGRTFLDSLPDIDVEIQ